MITTSSGNLPAPLISPLNSGYQSQMEQISATLNKLEGGTIEVHKFADLAAFAGLMEALTHKV